MDEKVDKLSVDLMGIQIKMAVLERIMNKQKEIEKSIEELKQNQKHIFVGLKEFQLKIDNVDAKAENSATLLEKTRSTVAKKIKKVKSEIEGACTSLREQEKASEMMSVRVNRSEAKMEEIENQLVAMEMVGQEMSSQLKAMEHLMEKNVNQLNQISKQVEDCAPKTLSTVPSEFSDQLANLMQPTTGAKNYSEKIDSLNLQMNTLMFEHEKLLAKERVRNLQELEVKNNFDHMQQLISYGKPKIQRFSIFDYYSSHDADYTWKIVDIKTEDAAEYQSEVFALNQYPIDFQAKLRYAPAKCFLEMCYKKRGKSQQTLKMEMLPKVYFVLKGQQKINDALLSLTYIKLNEPIKFDTFYHVANLPLNCPNFVSNLSITLDMLVEPLPVAKQIYSYDGTLYWSVEKYSTKLQNGSQVSQWPCESPYFYTSAEEYRVQCVMSFANCGIQSTDSHPQFNDSAGKTFNNSFGVRQFGKTSNYSFGVQPTNQQSFTKLGQQTNIFNLLIAEIRFVFGDTEVDLPNLHFHRTTITVFNAKNPQAHVVKQLVGDIKENNSCSCVLQSNYSNADFAQNDTLFYKVNVELLQQLPSLSQTQGFSKPIISFAQPAQRMF